MLKRILCTMLIFSTLASFAACGSDTSKPEDTTQGTQASVDTTADTTVGTTIDKDTTAVTEDTTKPPVVEPVEVKDYTNKASLNENTKGTAVYKINSDGTATIGNTTIKASSNSISGPTVATDDLGRTLATAETTKPIDNEKYVGLFYFLWFGAHGTDGPYDISKILEEGGADAKKANYSKWGPIGAMHFFAEPLYGYYLSADTWVMRKHIEEFINADIDFLYIDVTNGYTYINNAKLLMQVIDSYLKQGFDAPQIVFYTHTSAPKAIQELYTGIYATNFCPDTWFKIDGKPVIVAYNEDMKKCSTEIQSFFTLRQAQWPNEKRVRPSSWSWMDFTRPQRSCKDTNGDIAVSVSIAQHNGTVCFSDSAIYGNNTNRGRSFHNNKNDKTENAYLYGYNFEEQWDRAISLNAKYVLVTGWNEWVAQRQSTTNNTVKFIDTASLEFSRDAEMMKGGYFDNYYMQLIQKIREFKGTTPSVIQDKKLSIDISGGFEQWNEIDVSYKDYKGDTADRKAMYFGKIKATDNSGRNDIVNAKVTCDSENLFFYVETAKAITAYDTDSSWMQLFINTGKDENKAFYGYDYIVNYKAKSANTTTIAKCTTTDNTYGYVETALVNYKVEDNKLMIKVPLEALAIADPSDIKISFKWADSKTLINSMEAMYTDGDAAPHGRLNFLFQNK